MVLFEPLNVIAADERVSCAIHARDSDLLDKQEWKHLKEFTWQQKKML
jgi:hypothetical protein